MQTYDPSLNSQNQVSTRYLPVKKKRKKKVAPKISASELRKRIEEVEARFIKPKPMDQLNGDLGVTLFDIAHSLGTSHAELKRKVERSGELEYLQAFGYETMTDVIVPAAGPRCETYILCVMSAQHVAAKYSNLAGRSYLDFLIRSKDALKVSLDVLQKTESTLIKAQEELGEANEKIDLLTQPKITRRNNIVFKKIVAEKSSLFHDTTYKVEKELIKQPKKEDEVYQEHYLQKLARITRGNVKSMQLALEKIHCDREVLNKRMNQLSDISGDVDSLINPKNQEKYNTLVKKIEKEA